MWQASGSHDVKADGAVIPAKYAGVSLWTVPAHYPNPVYRMPTGLRLAYNKAAIALGIAKGALRVFSDIAQNKIPMLSSSSLAKYRACRAFLMEAMQAVEDELTGNDELPGAKTTQDARLACVHAGNECMELVDMLHNTAGTTAMRAYSPLERMLRDAHGTASHRWIAHPLYEELGSILLGNEPSRRFFVTPVSVNLFRDSFQNIGFRGTYGVGAGLILMTGGAGVPIGPPAPKAKAEPAAAAG